VNKPYSSVPRPAVWRILVLGVAPWLVLVAAFLYLVTGAARLEQHRVLIRQNNDIVFAAGAIEIAIQDAERGQRGYLLTDNPDYLKPYTDALARIERSIQRVQSLTAGEPEQQERILELQRSLTTKLDELARTIEVRRTQGRDAAISVVNTNVGEEAMRSILLQIGGIIQAEQMVREQRLGDVTATEHEITVTSAVGGAAALFAIAWTAFALYGAYRRTRLSEHTLRMTLDSVREGVGAFGPDHRLIAWNRTFAQVARIPPDSLAPGQRLETVEGQMAGGSVGESLLALDERARLAGKPVLVEHARADGSVIELFHNPGADGGFVTTFTDVTDQRRAEALQRQSQKMESLGQMTGGIAHDFNNLLTIIVGNLELLKGQIEAKSGIRRYIDMALIGANRGARLTHQLLAFARRQPLEPRSVNLAQLLPDLADMLRRTLGELIEIELVGSPGLWNVQIDPHQFESAVLNLAINGRDAMPQGGKLTLETANVRLDEAYAALHDEVQAGQYVVFGVTDTGTGMPPEIVARAFDPFFSTKGENGTGLGLSMVFGFVKQSGGHIKIYSEPGHGTTIKLYLPRTLDRASGSLDRILTEDITGTETVLVVEDDEAVRATVAGLVAGLGYRVLEAANGSAALTVLEGEERIDLLFTDVIMPGPVSSRVLSERAKQLRPGIKVLFTSGYTENTIVHNGRLDQGVQLISKPYGREQLAQKLRSVLEGVS
jgi:signal transduction histidine kinase